MPFPAGWPPRPATTKRSIRFFVEGTVTADFADNAFLFADTPAKSQTDSAVMPPPGVSAQFDAGVPARPGPPFGEANPTPFGAVPQAVIVSYRHCQNIRLKNIGAGALEYSFNDTEDIGAGAGIHGHLLAGEAIIYRERYEGGIAVRGRAGGTPAFQIEAW